MIATVLYGLIAIGLASAGGYAVLTFFEASKTMSTGADNTSRLSVAAQMIRSNLRPAVGTGELYPPAGFLDPAVGYTTLPQWLAIQDRSASGIPFLYCPIVASGLTVLPSGYTANAVTASGYTAPVKFPSGTTYAVTTVTSNVTTASQPYVVNSVINDGGLTPTILTDTNLTNQGVIAIIIAAAGTSTAPPQCSSVTYDTTNGFTAAGGVVRVVTTGFTKATEVAASREVVLYADVDSNLPPPASRGSNAGLAPENPTSLVDALALVSSFNLKTATISMADGTYALTTDPFSFTQENTGVNLRLEKTEAGTVTINTTAIATTNSSGFVGPEIDFIQLATDSIIISGNLTVSNGAKATFTNSSITNLFATRADVILDGTYSGRVMNVENGTLTTTQSSAPTLTAAAPATTPLSLQNSTWTIGRSSSFIINCSGIQDEENIVATDSKIAMGLGSTLTINPARNSSGSVAFNAIDLFATTVLNGSNAGGTIVRSVTADNANGYENTFLAASQKSDIRGLILNFAASICTTGRAPRTAILVRAGSSIVSTDTNMTLCSRNETLIVEKGSNFVLSGVGTNRTLSISSIGSVTATTGIRVSGGSRVTLDSIGTIAIGNNVGRAFNISNSDVKISGDTVQTLTITSAVGITPADMGNIYITNGSLTVGPFVTMNSGFSTMAAAGTRTGITVDKGGKFTLKPNSSLTFTDSVNPETVGIDVVSPSAEVNIFGNIAYSQSATALNAITIDYPFGGRFFGDTTTIGSASPLAPLFVIRANAPVTLYGNAVTLFLSAPTLPCVGVTFFASARTAAGVTTQTNLRLTPPVATAPQLATVTAYDTFLNTNRLPVETYNSYIMGTGMACN